jgi:hypothetical protein
MTLGYLKEGDGDKQAYVTVDREKRRRVDEKAEMQRRQTSCKTILPNIQ